MQEGSEGIIVWGCIIAQDPSDLVVIDGIMNSASYITFEDCMIPSVTELLSDNLIFQQDNATYPCITIRWFEENDVEVLPWPSRTPDLNPIENLWDQFGAKLAKAKSQI